MPKVSVIIPVYNVEKYLKECLNSIVNQTLKDIEIICVNDGSTDKSLDILNEYAKKDSRITVLTQENQGAGAARNRGLDIAKGEYLSILDSDDFFKLDMLEKMYNKAIETDAEIVMCRENSIDYENNLNYKFYFRDEIMPNKEIFSGQDIKDNAFAISRNIAWDKMFKASFIFDNNIRFHSVRIIDDAHFVFVAFALANRITTLNKALVFHRINLPNQQTSSSNFNFSKTRVQDFVLAYDKILDSLVKNNIFESFEKTYINTFCKDIMHYKKKLNFSNRQYMYNKLKTVVFPKIKIFDKDINYYDSFNKFYLIQGIKNPLFKCYIFFKRFNFLLFKVNCFFL